jgi:voltage-gated potassium channel
MATEEHFRAKIHGALNPPEHGTAASRIVETVLVVSIFGSVFAAVWSTVTDISPDMRLWLGRVSVATFIAFFVEYVARIIATTGSDPGAEEHPAEALLNYLRSPLGIIDLLVVLPQLAHALGW